MRIVRYDRFAGIDQLYIDDAPMPQAVPGQVVVQVYASCINAGSLSALEGASYIPIRDIAGVVTARGAGVEAFSIGSEVLGWAQDWAAHAEYVAVPAEQLIVKPSELSWDVAGSLFVTPMAGLGAVQAVEPHAGETVVIAGASGAVGLTAAQLAKHRGAAVIGLASAANADLLRLHGIIAVDYANDPAEGIRSAAEGKPVDAFIDTVGKGYVDLALELEIAKDRINTVVDYKAAKEKGIKSSGTMNAGGTAGLSELATMAARGELDIPIHVTFPLGEVQAAYRAVSDRSTTGRVVLHPQD